MKKLLFIFLVTFTTLLVITSSEAHAFVCNDIVASISLSPDPPDKKPFIGTPFYLNVSGLKPNESYSIGIRDDGPPPPDVVGFRFSDNVVDQYNANNDGETTGPYRNGQGTRFNQTGLTFGLFDPTKLAKPVVPNKNYYITLYLKGTGLAASHYMPCPNTLVKQFQSGTSPTPAVSDYDAAGGSTVGTSGTFNNKGLNLDHCVFRGKDGPGVTTALGCIPTDASALANVVFGFALGIAGALAILFIILGGFKVATSQGNPDALEEGRDQITKAIAGLVFILLATAILGIIGIDLLGFDFFHRNGGSININP